MHKIRLWKMSGLERFIFVLLTMAMFIFMNSSDHVPSTIAQSNSVGPLCIHKSGRFFSDAQGNPFFWQGDTPWLLHARLLKEDVLKYLDVRQAQGFNVIQVFGTASGLTTAAMLMAIRHSMMRILLH